MSWPALAWGCCVLVPRALPGMQPPWWLSCPMDSGKCSFPAMWETQCGSGHWLPTTELGWQGALGTARGEPAIAAPNGAVWLEGGHCGASVGDRGLQTALWHGCLGKVCLSLVSLTAW